MMNKTVGYVIAMKAAWLADHKDIRKNDKKNYFENKKWKKSQRMYYPL